MCIIKEPLILYVIQLYRWYQYNIITWFYIYNDKYIYCWKALKMFLNIFNLKLIATPETAGRYKRYITIFSILQGFKGRFFDVVLFCFGFENFRKYFIWIGFTTLILFIGVFWILFTTLVLILGFNGMCFTTFIDICWYFENWK